MRECGQNAGPVAGIRFAPARSAVVHVAEHLLRVDQDIVAPHAPDMGDKTDSARIMFVGRIVQTVLLWQGGMSYHDASGRFYRRLEVVAASLPDAASSFVRPSADGIPFSKKMLSSWPSASAPVVEVSRSRNSFDAADNSP